MQRTGQCFRKVIAISMSLSAVVREVQGWSGAGFSRGLSRGHLLSMKKLRAVDRLCSRDFCSISLQCMTIAPTSRHHVKKENMWAPLHLPSTGVAGESVTKHVCSKPEYLFRLQDLTEGRPDGLSDDALEAFEDKASEQVRIGFDRQKS